ncbi:MAG TPA: hypothetical protein PLU53_01930 [Bacteroidia bacterium]|nr:hypothetical protein [Bacteroidia bacterium]
MKTESPLKTASIQELKTELNTLSVTELKQICLRLAKHKMENKELVSFLIFEAGNPELFISKVKEEIDRLFPEINKSNLYLAKKGLRKILRITNKHIRFADTYEAEAELLIHFCEQVKTSGIRYENSQVLMNLYNQQVKKIHAAISRMHEDLQFDYQKELEKI